MFEYVLGSLALAILDLFAIGYMSKKYYKMKQSGYRFFYTAPMWRGIIELFTIREKRESILVEDFSRLKSKRTGRM